MKNIIIWLLIVLPLVSGFKVAMFIICTRSHIAPNIGMIKELLNQNHSVVCVLNKACHEKLNQFKIDLVHNDGITPEILTKLSKESAEGRSVVGILSSTHKIIEMFHIHATLHQDVLDYFENNKVDVILSSVLALSSIHIADKFNIPLVFHAYTLGFFLREKCRDCKYTGTVVPLSPFSSLSPSLPVIVFSKLFYNIISLFLYPSLVSFDSQRKLLGLEDIYPKSLLHYNYARFPYIYQNYHPLVPPSLELPDGRWLVGYIPPDVTQELSEEYSTFLMEESLPVVYVSFGTVVKLDEERLTPLYQQIVVQNGFKVILSLRMEQQIELVESLGLRDLDELFSEIPKHVKIVEYAPQRELLQTEQVKVFVSHAGYSSVMESIVSSTPLLLFPVVGDQSHNANIMVEIGCAMQFNDLSSLNSLVLSLLKDYESYKSCMENAAQEMSKAGGAVEVVAILERLSSRGYEGMSFDYHLENIPDMYSALLTLLFIPISLLILMCGLCYCCCWRRMKKNGKVKKE